MERKETPTIELEKGMRDDSFLSRWSSHGRLTSPQN